MEPVKEFESFLVDGFKIGGEDLFSIGLDMSDSDKIEIKVIMQYCHLPNSIPPSDVISPISLGMKPVKELESGS